MRDPKPSHAVKTDRDHKDGQEQSCRTGKGFFRKSRFRPHRLPVNRVPGTGRSTYKRGSRPTRTYKANTCLFWDCNKRIREDHVFCYEHFQGFQAGDVDECPGCGFAKDAQYEVCLDCRNSGRRPSARGSKGGGRSRSWYKPEYSPHGEARDAKTNTFYVYLLKPRWWALLTAGQDQRYSESAFRSIATVIPSLPPAGIRNWCGSGCCQVVASALQGHRLVTADERILNWSGQLSRLDARQ